MNIAIIDDVRDDRDIIYHHLTKYFEGNPIHLQIDVYPNAEEFLEVWSKGLYDLLFIDIYLSGMTGVELTTQIRKETDDCLIIFTTSSEEYALVGYQLRVLDYLIKPVTYTKFSSTLDYCLDDLVKRNKYIQVKESRSYVKILLDNILFTDYFNHYIQIHTEKHVTRSYMKFEEFSPMLLCYPQFLCCYRNCIVNMDKIQSCSKNDFVLHTDERVPITRVKRQELQQAYMDYQFNKMHW